MLTNENLELKKKKGITVHIKSINFMIQIKYYKTKNIYSVTLFEIWNDERFVHNIFLVSLLLQDCLRYAYFAKIEIFFAKSTIDKSKN